MKTQYEVSPSPNIHMNAINSIRPFQIELRCSMCAFYQNQLSLTPSVTHWQESVQVTLSKVFENTEIIGGIKVFNFLNQKLYQPNLFTKMFIILLVWKTASLGKIYSLRHLFLWCRFRTHKLLFPPENANFVLQLSANIKLCSLLRGVWLRHYWNFHICLNGWGGGAS